MNPGPSVAASLLCSSGNTGVANGAYGRFLCLDGDDLRGRSLSERKHRHEGLVLKVRDGWLRWPVGSTGIMSQAATALRLRVQSMASAQDDCFQIIPGQCAHHWTLASHALIQSHCKLPYAIMDGIRSCVQPSRLWIAGFQQRCYHLRANRCPCRLPATIPRFCAHPPICPVRFMRCIKR